jgi:hypothetical protein
MVFKTLLIVLVIAVLMGDVGPTKKTKEEEREDKEIAEAVNRTLAEEEEERKRDEEKKRKQDKEVKPLDPKRKEGTPAIGEDEASPSRNESRVCPVCPKCPSVDSCPEEKACEDCPKEKPCPGERPCKECPSCEECGPCPEVKPCRPCKPCGPCPPFNRTNVSESGGCPESELRGMPTLVAMAIGAVATLFLTGVAAALGLLLRYASPFESGFVFLATIIIMWYLCSRYPEAARELGERVVATLRDATIALGHRVAEAIQRHSNQVGFSVSVLFFLLSDLSPIF